MKMQANIISIQEASRNLNTINAQNKRNALHFFCLTKPSNLSIKNKITRKNKCKQVHYTEARDARFVFVSWHIIRYHKTLSKKKYFLNYFLYLFSNTLVLNDLIRR